MSYCSQQKLEVAEDLKVDSSVDMKKLNQAEQVAVLMRRVTELEKRSDRPTHFNALFCM